LTVDGGQQVTDGIDTGNSLSELTSCANPEAKDNLTLSASPHREQLTLKASKKGSGLKRTAEECLKQKEQSFGQATACENQHSKQPINNETFIRQPTELEATMGNRKRNLRSIQSQR
jgi:hypothetical protein